MCRLSAKGLGKIDYSQRRTHSYCSMVIFILQIPLIFCDLLFPFNHYFPQLHSSSPSPIIIFVHDSSWSCNQADLSGCPWGMCLISSISVMLV